MSDAADIQDEVILQETLYISITADDIYESESVQELVELQADQMMAASRRRMDRQERWVEELRKAVEAGTGDHQELQKAVAEMKRRIDVGYLAIDRSTVLKQVVAAARAAALKKVRGGRMEKFQGSRPFTPSVMRTIELAFVKQFKRPLPISAHGDTAMHRALGLDHSGRVDVAVHPDHPEGQWLRRLLQTMRVPYYGFRTSIPGSATAPHIHIGPGSSRRTTTLSLWPKATQHLRR